ncbi:MAG: 50S ribosomal protein L10 [Pirellulaceae bacterium]|jgi:ribosomal protein L10|nr:50S ribosomal protein L10 [Pirellulaceae bacterium]HJN12338.1 50S ribosomal protein L10 [Pirellulaceae bacterium]
MSKYVKDLVADDIRRRIDGVDDVLLVNMIGLDANKSVELRRQLRDKDISVLVIKNSLARRATKGTPLAPAFENAKGAMALVWGGEDFVSLVKEIASFHKDDGYKEFEARGGVMDGENLTQEKVLEISKWPNRAEQLSILMGQVLSPGSKLLSQIEAAGANLASQIKQISEEEE